MLRKQGNAISKKGAVDKNTVLQSTSAYLRSWHLPGSFSSYMVAFKILLRYNGNQQTANTITRQKTVLATSRLWKRRLETFVSKQKSHAVSEGANLLGVIVGLSVPQHFPGHQRVENGGPSQRQAEVEAEEPPILYWFIELLIKHEGGSRSGMRKTPGLHLKDSNAHKQTYIM